MAAKRNLSYEVFVSGPTPRDGQVLPNGEGQSFSPVASTLILGTHDAVLTDPAFTYDQARALGDWVASKRRAIPDIFITHGHGDHWFAAGLLAERFGARVVATDGTIAQMRAGLERRADFWDKAYPGQIPPSPVTAVPVPGNRITLEGEDLVVIPVGHSDTDETSVLHVPQLELVVAGDVIYNGAHLYLSESVATHGFQPWRNGIGKVEAMNPRHIVCGHQNKDRDDDAARVIAETRAYLDDAEQALSRETSATGFFEAMITSYPDHVGRTILWISAVALYASRNGDTSGNTPPAQPLQSQSG